MSILAFVANRLSSAGHPETDVLWRGRFRIDHADDLALANAEQAVTKSCKLFEFFSYEQNGASGVTQADELAVDKFDRADIDPAGWLRHEQELWLEVKFTAYD